jgi:uncharacterized protein
VTTVLVASDTHGNLAFVLRTLDAHPEVSAVLHLGDHCDDAVRLAALRPVPVHVVRGNGDVDCPHGCPTETVLTLEGHRLLLTHGHRQEVKQGLDRLVRFASLQHPAVDAVLFGHTHRPLWRLVDRPGGRRLLLLNPGTARPLPVHGNSVPSIALLRIEAGDGVDGLVVDWVEPA